jgi:hypothetical protein
VRDIRAKVVLRKERKKLPKERKALLEVIIHSLRMTLRVKYKLKDKE